ncbi:hypothetical protein ACZ87_03890, partial [Candidatus Erwinia dacicola]
MLTGDWSNLNTIASVVALKPPFFATFRQFFHRCRIFVT